MMSKEELLKTARINQHKPDMLEKFHLLLDALEQFMAIPFLRERLALKGGTALNLFHFENIPRLSVDIDLNYIGASDAETMQKDRIIINETIHKIFEQKQFELYRNPQHHAGGKMVWRYPSVLGQKGNLEIDLNYMYRQPLWPICWKSPEKSLNKSFKMALLDIHELAAGKLAALFDRQASRDLFDANYLLTKSNLDPAKLRLSFVIYLAMSKFDLTNLKTDVIAYDITDIRNRLLPVLQQQGLPRSITTLKVWAEQLLDSLHSALNKILPLTTEEKEFISLIKNTGEIKPELISNDLRLNEIVRMHPAIRWAALRKS